jgi:hypothetical protein
VLVCIVAGFCLLAGASGSRFVGSTEMGMQITGVGKHWAWQLERMFTGAAATVSKRQNADQEPKRPHILNAPTACFCL